MNPMKMMKQVQKMQADMERMQKEIADTRHEAVAGGGSVKAVVSGDGELQDLVIDSSLVEDGDAEMIQDLVLTAVREATQTAKQDASDRMGEIMPKGMPGLPGMGF